MANGKEHMVAGALVAASFNWVGQRSALDGRPGRTDWGEIVLMGLAGGVLGLLADVLEPATSPNHRRFFHSVAFVVVVVWWFTKMWRSEPRTDQHRRTWPALLLAFLSHHFLDSLTKRALPWLGFRL